MIASSASIARAGRWLGAVLTFSLVALPACSQGDPSSPSGGGGATTTTTTTTTGTGTGTGTGGADAGIPGALYTAEEIREVVVSGNTLFFTAFVYDPMTHATKGSLYRASTAGGEAQLIDVGSPAHLILGSDHVYWLSFDFVDPKYNIKRMPISGGASELVASAGYSGAGAFLVDAESVYYFTSTNVPNYGIASQSLSGGAPQTLLAETNLGETPSLIGVDATSVYYYASPLTGTAGFYRIPRAGGVPKLIQAIDSGAPDVATLGAANIYFAEFNGLDVLAAPLSGGKPTTIGKGDGLHGVGAIVSDGKDIYFADGITLSRLPVAGGAVETLLKPDLSVRSFAIVPDAAYWVGCLQDSSRCGILKLAK